MMAQPNRVFSRQEIESEVWGREQETSDTLRSHMHVLPANCPMQAVTTRSRTCTDSVTAWCRVARIRATNVTAQRAFRHVSGSKFGLRLRVALAMALACLLIVGALGFTLFTASEDMEDSLISQIVAEEMDYLVQRHRENRSYQRSGLPISRVNRRDSAGQSQLPKFLRGFARAGTNSTSAMDEFGTPCARGKRRNRYYVSYEVGLARAARAGFKLLVLLSV